MPVISRFQGIVLKMYFGDREHNPPHIHAIYGEYIGVFMIDNGEMFQGDLPLKEQRLVKRFVEVYRERLIAMWKSQRFEVLTFFE